jgi:hypothetical protein
MESGTSVLVKEGRGEDTPARAIGDRVGVVWSTEYAVVLES